MRFLMWLMKTPWHWSLASAAYSAALYLVGCLVWDQPVEILWLAAIPLIGFTFGQVGWRTTYGAAAREARKAEGGAR